MRADQVDELADTWILINNPVVWATFFVAFLCYGLLIRFCFVDSKDEHWFELTQFWLSSIRQMLTALPLLGLLGTVSGLMDTFIQMSREGELAAPELVSGGIRDALFTTQLGLVLVVPGMLLAGLLSHHRRNWLIRSEHEILNRT
jgi:biopolymer transport protein ExbB